MQILDMLEQMGGIQSMAREFGVSESQAASGAAALLPAVLGGLRKQTQGQPAGLDGLIGMLGGLGGGGLIDEVLAPKPTNVSPGNDILGQIFGSRDVSRTVGSSCLCNSLGASIGLGQRRSGEFIEPPLITLGDDLDSIRSMLANERTSYSAQQVIEKLLE